MYGLSGCTQLVEIVPTRQQGRGLDIFHHWPISQSPAFLRSPITFRIVVQLMKRGHMLDFILIVREAPKSCFASLANPVRLFSDTKAGTGR